MFLAVKHIWTCQYFFPLLVTLLAHMYKLKGNWPFYWLMIFCYLMQWNSKILKCVRMCRSPIFKQKLQQNLISDPVWWFRNNCKRKQVIQGKAYLAKWTAGLWKFLFISVLFFSMTFVRRPNGSLMLWIVCVPVCLCPCGLCYVGKGLWIDWWYPEKQICLNNFIEKKIKD